MNTMRTAWNTRWHQVAETALRASARRVVRRGGDGWAFTLSNGRPLKASARLDANWLTLEARPAAAGAWLEGGAAGAWQVLRLNARLPGLAKVGCHPQGHAVLRAEIPLEPGEDLTPAVGAACAGFLFARAALAGYGAEFKNSAAGRPEAPGRPSAGRGGSAASGGSDLRELCAQIGWPCSDGRDGPAKAELECFDGLAQAALEQGDGDARLVAGLCACRALPETCRRAIGLFLLRAGGVLRMVRPAVEEQGDETRILLEARAAARPSAGSLLHALGGLSAGCRLCREEVKLLRDEAVAARYLEVSGRAAGERERSQVMETKEAKQ